MARKRLLVSLAAMLILVAVAAMLFSLPVYAQELPIPTAQQATPTATVEHPDGPSITDIPQEVIDAQATNDADLSSRVIFDYHIAYLIAENTFPAEALLSSENLQRYAGAVIVGNWDEFVTLNSERPFDIVLLHTSMYEQVDTEWFHQAYRNGVIIMGLSIQHNDLTALIGDNCIKHPNPTYVFQGDFLIYLNYSLKLADESYRAMIDKAELEDCTSKYTTGDTYSSVSHGVTQWRFRSNHSIETSLEYLVKLMVAETKNYGKSNPRLSGGE